MPARHGPPVVSALMPQTMGSLLELPRPDGSEPFRLYISGDTLVYEQIKEIPARYPDIDLMLIHLGVTRVLGILVTMDVKQGIAMLRIIGPRHAVPIHYNDYAVFKDPLGDFDGSPGGEEARPRGPAGVSFEEFVRMVGQAAPGVEVHVLRHGDTYEFGLSRAGSG